jgi:hypothetical protein
LLWRASALPSNPTSPRARGEVAQAATGSRALAADNFNFTGRVHHFLTMRPNPAAAGFQRPMFTQCA